MRVSHVVAALCGNLCGAMADNGRNGDDRRVDDEPALGAWDEIAGRRVLTGSCSWTDRTLVNDSDWYPRRSMSAEERLRFYAAQFPLTEIDSTYYAPPSERQARLWAERTPPGFRFDVKAYSLLTPTTSVTR